MSDANCEDKISADSSEPKESDTTPKVEDSQTEASTSSPASSWWGWAQDVAAKAQEQAKEMAIKAQEQAKELSIKAQEQAKELSMKAQETAAELAKKAAEIQQTYDLEGTANIFMGLGLSQSLAEAERNEDSPSKSEKSPNQLDLAYVTENIIAMAFPYEAEVARVQGGNDIRAVAAFLRRRHAGHYMIWNISEESYNYSLFGDQVCLLL